MYTEHICIYKYKIYCCNVDGNVYFTNDDNDKTDGKLRIENFFRYYIYS